VSQPLDADPQVTAGPPFGLANEIVPTTVADFATRFSSSLAGQDRIVATLRSRSEFADDVVGSQRIDDIEQIAARRQPFIPTGA
jgi:hypothetical protein